MFFNFSIVIFIYFNILYLIEGSKNTTSVLNDYGFYPDNQMSAIGTYFSNLMGCGAQGWCAFRCCPVENARSYQYRSFPNPASLSAYGRNRVVASPRTTNSYNFISRNPTGLTTSSPAKQCANACMPKCSNQCLQRYNQIVTSFMNSLTAIDVMGQPVNEPSQRNFQFSPKKKSEGKSKIFKCRDECRPYCTPQCTSTYEFVNEMSTPKVCKTVCMPECTEECLTAPPLMIPCVYDQSGCRCQSGYVRCSEMTCCMKYKTIAIKYNNRMTSMSFSDNQENKDEAFKQDIKSLDKQETQIKDDAGNETSVYLSELRKMNKSAEKSQVNLDLEQKSKK